MQGSQGRLAAHEPVLSGAHIPAIAAYHWHGAEPATLGISVIASLSLAVSLANPALASDRYAAEVNDEHVIVTYQNPHGIVPPADAADTDRLALRQRQVESTRISVGNHRLESGDPGFITPTQCGWRSSHRLVLCLSTDAALSDSDQLLLLAFMTVPAAVYARSLRVQAQVRTILSQMPDRLDNAHFAVLPEVACGIDCERVLVIDK